jgi:hypothetical protein
MVMPAGARGIAACQNGKQGCDTEHDHHPAHGLPALQIAPIPGITDTAAATPSPQAGLHPHEPADRYR